jgi:histidine triad (HIT) family protein
MKSEADCTFCSIVSGEASASTVFEDAEVLAFMDINPVTEGHVVVVPRNHYPYLTDLPDEVASRMFLVAKQIAGAIQGSGLKSEGVNLFYADGKAAFQEVFHSHLHVFPRYEGDGFKIEADWEDPPTQDQLESAASIIRLALRIAGVQVQ